MHALITCYSLGRCQQWSTMIRESPLLIKWFCLLINFLIIHQLSRQFSPVPKSPDILGLIVLDMQVMYWVCISSSSSGQELSLCYQYNPRRCWTFCCFLEGPMVSHFFMYYLVLKICHKDRKEIYYICLWGRDIPSDYQITYQW